MLQPEVDNEFGVAVGVTPGSVDDALEQLQRPGVANRVTAVLVTSPTYYGVCSDIAGLAQVRRMLTSASAAC